MPDEPGSTPGTSAEIDLDVVICTYDNAALLDRTLAHLAAQSVPPGVRWRVLVVDNNCTDATADVVERHARSHRIPGLRRVVEREQGKTPAILRGIAETSADWFAIVDDDCLLDPAWITEAVTFLRSGPVCGAFGGRVELRWETPPPPGLADYGLLFAEQVYGERAQEVATLVGAGMVIERRALERSGWTSSPLLADRVGKRLGACGDLEMALRIRAAGYALWFVPACRLEHVMPARRARPGHLGPLASGLGEGAVLTSAMTAPASGTAWLRAALGESWTYAVRAVRRTVSVAAGRRTRLCARIDRQFAAGALYGTFELVRMGRRRRRMLVGAAAGVPRPIWKL